MRSVYIIAIFFLFGVRTYGLDNDSLLREAKLAKERTVIYSQVKIDPVKIKSILKKYDVQLIAMGFKFAAFYPYNSKAVKVGPAFWKEITKNFPDVKITTDSLMVTVQKPEDCPDKLPEVVEEVLKPIRMEYLKSNCQLTPRCQDGQRAAWAKYVVGADLADKIVEEQLKSGKGEPTSIGVVDTGFDTSQETSLSTPDFSSQKGFDAAGSADRDEEGHGTSVLSMIAARKTGVSAHLGVKSYRVTRSDHGGIALIVDVASAVEKACLENDIVNVSWVGDNSEFGLTTYRDQSWYQLAETQGCLVVAASGNKGIKNWREKTPLKANVLYAGATNDLGQSAMFSSASDTNAPGEGVFTLRSRQAEAEKKQNTCEIEGIEYDKVNGTSFASPLTSAVMGQVTAILKARGILPTDKQRKVQLIKSIVQASELWAGEAGLQPQINAYLATRLASMITNRSPFKPSDLVKLGKASTFKECEAPVTSCKSPPTGNMCALDCVNDLRKRFFMCPNMSRDQLDDLAHRLTAMQEDELARQVTLRRDGKNSMSHDLMENLERQWNASAENGGKRSIDMLFAAANAGQKDFITAERMLKSINSYKVIDCFEPDGKIKTVDSNKICRERFKAAFSAMPAEERTKFIAQMTQVFEVKSAVPGIIDHLLEFKDLTSMERKYLEDAKNQILARWMSYVNPDDASIPPSVVRSINSLFWNDKSKEFQEKILNEPVRKDRGYIYKGAFDISNLSSERKKQLAFKILASQDIDNETAGFAIKELMKEPSSKDIELVKATLLSRPTIKISSNEMLVSFKNCDMICRRLGGINEHKFSFSRDANYWGKYSQTQIQLFEEVARDHPNDRDLPGFVRRIFKVFDKEENSISGGDLQIIYKNVDPQLKKIAEQYKKNISSKEYVPVQFFDALADNVHILRENNSDLLKDMQEVSASLKDSKDSTLVELRQKLNRALSRK